MTARDTRAALVLGCAVAIAVSVALFPAAFGVALPENPLAPAPVASDGSGEWTSAPVVTPAPATPTPAPAGAPAGSGEDLSLPSVDADLLGGVVGAALLLVVVLAVRDYRTDGPGTLRVLQRVLARVEAPPVGRWLATLSRLTATALVAFGAGLGRIVGDLTGVVRIVLWAVPGAVGRTRTGSAGLLPWSRSVLARIVLTPFTATLSVLGARNRPWLAGPIFGGADDDGADGGDGDPSTVTGARTASSDAPASVIAAWARLESLVPITNGRARTAGEYARAAIDAGFPATPVRRLLAAFRAVRYGGRTDGGDRLASARRALAALLGGDRE